MRRGNRRKEKDKESPPPSDSPSGDDSLTLVFLPSYAGFGTNSSAQKVGQRKSVGETTD